MNKNMKIFNECAAKILDSLYDSFPVGKEYKILDFPDLNNANDSDVFFSTVQFLKNENYINYQNQYYGGFSGVTLTSKGLSILNAAPAVLEKKESLSQLIKNALRNGSEAIISDTMKKVFAFGAHLAINNIDIP